MRVFKSAVVILRRNIVYIMIYAIALSFLGVLMAAGAVPDTELAERYEPEIAIIQEDPGAIAEGLAQRLDDRTEVVDVGTSRRELQDAFAKSLVGAVVRIPAGFSDDFVEAVAEGTEPPAILITNVEESADRIYVLREVDGFLNTVATHLTVDPDAGQSQAVERASEDAQQEVRIDLVDAESVNLDMERFTIFYLFNAYTAIISIIALSHVIITPFNKLTVKRRHLSSPLRPIKMDIEVYAATGLVSVLVAVWVTILGSVIYRDFLATMPWYVPMLYGLTFFLMCVVALALGVLIAQVTTEQGVNIVGNLIALVIAFFGGLWVPLELTSETVQLVSRFLPASYYADAIRAVPRVDLPGGAGLGGIFADWGMMLLFAAALFAVAFAVIRSKRRAPNG